MPSLDERTRAGVAGEEQAAEITRQRPICHIPNPIVPSRDRPEHFCETNHLVYTGGKVFTIETKNYKGLRIMHATEPGDECLHMRSQHLIALRTSATFTTQPAVLSTSTNFRLRSPAQRNERLGDRPLGFGWQTG